MTDLHTHTLFSHDGRGDIEELVQSAIQKGFKYLGFSEHADIDSKYAGQNLRQLDFAAYLKRAHELKEKYKEQIIILAGVEFGFIKNTAAQREYLDAALKYCPDFIINSVHSGQSDTAFPSGSSYFDYYNESYYEKQKLYTTYLECILQSTQSMYPYDIIGHIGYATRYAPYEDKSINYFEFKELLDAIFSSIIKKGKILEVNTSCRSGYTEYLPDYTLLEAYYKAGGRKISYGSDCHAPDRLGEKRDLVISDLKKIGFDCITVPCKGKHIEVNF